MLPLLELKFWLRQLNRRKKVSCEERAEDKENHPVQEIISKDDYSRYCLKKTEISHCFQERESPGQPRDDAARQFTEIKWRANRQLAVYDQKKPGEGEDPALIECF